MNLSLNTFADAHDLDLRGALIRAFDFEYRVGAHADPTADGRDSIDLEEALGVLAADPSLIFVVETPESARCEAGFDGPPKY